MSRYYKIDITDDSTKKTTQLYTSHPDGVTADPGALNVEFDIAIASLADSLGSSFVKVWGISLQDIGQANDLNNKLIAVYGGMKKGLPLANAAQSGLLVSGRIIQAFGNWIGLEQTLDLQIITAGSVDNSPAPNLPNNIIVNWPAGTPLAAAIELALRVAYPNIKRKITISTKLVLSHDEIGFYGNLTQFAQYVKQVSADLIGGPYQGVDVNIVNDTFIVSDGTTPTTPKQIEFVDLIGQPTWLGTGQISVTMTMRADLTIGSYIKMPQTPVTTSATSLSQYRNASIQQGSYQINTMRHVGNFRQPAGQAWITNIICSAQQSNLKASGVTGAAGNAQ